MLTAIALSLMITALFATVFVFGGMVALGKMVLIWAIAGAVVFFVIMASLVVGSRADGGVDE